MKDVADTQTVVIPPVQEYDVVIRFPDKREWTLQYRNYEGCLDDVIGASVDLILEQTYPVYNWMGVEMKPAKKVKHSHIREANQLFFPFCLT